MPVSSEPNRTNPPSYNDVRFFVLGKLQTRQRSRFICPKCGWATNWSENQLKVQNKAARHVYDKHVEAGDWSF